MIGRPTLGDADNRRCTKAAEADRLRMTGKKKGNDPEIRCLTPHTSGLHLIRGAWPAKFIFIPV